MEQNLLTVCDIDHYIGTQNSSVYFLGSKGSEEVSENLSDHFCLTLRYM